MPFLYGNHVVKAHLGRMTEDIPEHQGVVIFSMNDVPLVSRLSQRLYYIEHYGTEGLWSNGALNC